MPVFFMLLKKLIHCRILTLRVVLFVVFNETRYFVSISNRKIMRKIYLAALAILGLTPFLSAQRICGTMEHLQMIQQQDPSIIRERESIEEFTNQFVANYQGGERVLVTIPVVVHVVWNTTAENISDAQIQSQIAVLNQDFRKLNADVANTPSAFAGLASDANIEFCLASTDPNGSATTGINRVQTTVTAFGTNDQVKSSSTGGANAWDRSKYLNLWVCDISGGILGYAQFPGGSAATDGVVVDYQYFGTIGTATAPFNKGRTATHEVGHWLNLYHIWGDDGTGCTGSDQVSDTPNQGGSNYGCPAFPRVSCSNGANGDMFMNYMDYTDDACMYMFSTGQVARMQALFATGGFRASLVTSNGCGIPTPVACGNVTGLTVSGITQTAANVAWTAVTGATGYNLQYKPTSSTTWTTVNPTTNSFALTGLTAGTSYNVQVRSVCSAGTGNYTASTFTTTSTTTSCTDNYETNNTSSQAKTIPVNTNVTARISTSTDKDWFKFTNTSTARNIRIDLTNLPADYDVRLYNPSGTQVAISQNGGTTAEAIVYNTTTVGTYKLQVYGYGGAFNATSCYTLRASISSTAFREDGTLEEAEITEMPGASEALQVLSAFPNPTDGKLNLRYFSERDGLIEINVVDAIGRTVMHASVSAQAGDNQTNMELGDLENGCYHIVITDGSNQAVQRILKQ